MNAAQRIVNRRQSKCPEGGEQQQEEGKEREVNGNKEERVLAAAAQ